MSLNYSRRQALKAILLLAWPTVLEQILSTAVSYVDTAMVGRIDKYASAAVSATMTVNWLIGSCVSALAIGFLSYISRAIGAKEEELAKRAAAQTVIAALFSGTLFTVLTLSLARYIPGWMNADEEIRVLAGQYFFIIYTPMIFRAAIIVFGTVLRAAGDTKTPMKVNVVTNIINVILNFFLIFEAREVSVFGYAFTLPGANLGVIGAAIGSAVAFVIGGAWMTFALYKSPIVSPKGIELRPDKEILKPCLLVALPAALQMFATSLGYVAFSAIINTIGTTATAAHGIANTAESAFYIPGYGMQAAASTLIGNAYGERNIDKMRAISRMLLIIETIVMFISGALLFAYAENMMALFTDDRDVIRLGARVLRMVAVSEPIYGVTVIIEGIFRGVGDTLHTFIFSVSGMWGVRILGTFICVIGFDMDLTAAWACMIAHNVALGILLTIRYRCGRWNPLTNGKELQRRANA